MNNRIGSYLNTQLQAYQRTQQAREAQAPSPTPASAPTGPVQAQQPAQPASPTALTKAEEQMIDRFFPPTPALSLRLYGPGRTTHNLNPGALGSRLDLRG